MLDVAHHRLALFWGLALLGLVAPWLLTELEFGDWTILAPSGRACAVASIHDGDTLRAVCDGERLQVRLYCIDAPEMSQAHWGRASRDHLRRMSPSQVTIRVHDTDRYGRQIGEILTADGLSLNLAMVSAGQAAVYPRYCQDPRFFAAERAARIGGMGIWASAGNHQRPWDHRRGSQ
ncbi:thermonuclease family protein [Thiocapsa roseopersicina]|uniref:Endonuclease YncB, thermonuclease family n=1 Tax=Thiocapsa roseopersicina TaxID=1058 RepID=A0A1H3CLB9_THIRO|nr:thermonuclease family protein [Thiocapsa roseopersicina]SDX54830.1 Endonuclease YncB, thermonuclease family [Thiocapsa roseopersicina]